nr:DUF6480 family protein [Streptomyces sp. TP-A0356]
MHRNTGTGGTGDQRHGAPGDAQPGRPTVQPGGVPPGETPPAESGIEDAVPQVEYQRTRGWAKAPLAIIMILVVLVAGFFLAYALSLRL